MNDTVLQPGHFDQTTLHDAAHNRGIVILRSIEAVWTQIARRRVFSCVLIAALTLVVRLALLRVDPKPEPRQHDEFAYILGGETFAKGRLANPTPPLWRFFETRYINMQPTYVSKYPPAQSAFLALGIRLFGHPWYGVVISVALMCGCLCWMLQGWLPPQYALLGGLFAFFQFGVTHYWMDSYWGGAVAAMGGSLVFGALPRLARHGQASAACAAGLGTAILANSRPFEGLVMVLLTFVALSWWTRGHFAVWLRPKVLLPLAVILLSTATAMAYYNFKTTGSPTTLAYTINIQRYQAVGFFWMLPPFPPRHREYRDPLMRYDWEVGDVNDYKQVRHNPALAVGNVYRSFRQLLGDGAGLILLFLIACAIPLAGIGPLRLTFGLVLLFFAAMTLSRVTYPHYLAPVVGALFVLAMSGLELLHSRSSSGVLVASIVTLAGTLFICDSVQTFFTHYRYPTNIWSFRLQVEAKLRAEPGKHLVLVHYKDYEAEIIYNGAEIDAQKLVWAFDFGPEGNRPLLDHYRDRKVWLAQPDGPRPTLEPYLSVNISEISYGNKASSQP